MQVFMGPGGVLMTAIEKQENKAETERRENELSERVNRLIDRVSKSSPTGKKIIESALERGISIGIDYDKKTLGSYMPSFQYVSLNGSVSDEQLLSTIVHECRHSEQTTKQDMSYTVHAAITETRAMEADAMAHECAAVYQMRKAEPKTYKLFCDRHAGIMKAYEASFNKDKDETKAKAEAFKAWYDHAEYVELYDRSVTDFMAMGMLNAGAYKKDMPDEVLKENFPYIEPSFFTSQRAMTVSEKTVQETEKVERGHIRHFFKFFGKSKIPTSADKFYVRAENGQIRPPVAQKKEQQNKAALAAKAAAARSGR